MLLLFCLIIFAQAEIVEKQENVPENIPQTLEEPRELKGAGKGITLDLAINVDVNKLLEQVFSAAKKAFTKPPSTSYQVRYPDGSNSRWISAQYNGLVISAYYHKTKWHSASVQSGAIIKKKYRSEAPKGQWAVAFCDSDTSIFSIDKTFYDDW